MKLIAQGAEAKIYLEKDFIIKNRIKKSYRLPQIDLRLRRLRTKSEAKLLSEASRAGVNVPRVLEINQKTGILKIEYIAGSKIRDWLERADLEQSKNILENIGKSIKKLHKYGIIHGDLTTSNILLNSNKVYFIDFGLGQISEKIEDKAVDLHVFKECLKSKHYANWVTHWGAFKKGYANKDIIKYMELVESRARYKKSS